MIWILVYLVSAILTWWYFHVAFSEKGIWEAHDVPIWPIVITILPVLNTIGAIIWLFLWPYEKPINLNKFFGL